jgi:chromosomal replication initiation ATPase DnaA
MIKEMTVSHYQEVHNLKQEIKRLRLLIVENKVQHDRELRLLKQEIVQPKTNINDNPTTWGEVLRVICEVMDMTPDQIIAKSRKRKALYARHMFNHICRKRLGMTFMEIGSISHLDHSTIISSVREFGDILHTDKEMQRYHAKVHTILHERLV